MSSVDLSEELSCSICLNIYSNPVMLSCGHNFCETCIKRSLHSPPESGSYSCPECREQFTHPPVLQKNLKLCNIVEHYKSAKAKMQNVVYCTYCVAVPTPAVKTCVRCEASLCDVHLSTHSKSARHVLIEPTTSLVDRKCSAHDKMLKYYCSWDHSFLCETCSSEEKHKSHPVMLLHEALDKWKATLCDSLKGLSLRKEEAEMVQQKLQQNKKRAQGNAADLKYRVSALFRDIKEHLLILETKVLNEVTNQEEKVSVLTFKELQKIENKKEELNKKIYQIKALCSITDPLTALKENAIDTDSEDLNFRQMDVMFDVEEVIIEVTLQRALYDLSAFIPELKANRGFRVEGASDMLLNANTAGNFVGISHDLKNANHCYKEIIRPHHPERFLSQQVLGTRKFSSGQHYWEVITSHKGDWSVGVTYNSIKRKGDFAHIGRNGKSWCLSWLKKDLCAEHDDEEEMLPPYFLLERLGIYLDYEGGELSFFELTDPIEHIYTFTANFTEPLHAAFYVAHGGWVTIGIE